jgi:serine/threonine-protein kinase
MASDRSADPLIGTLINGKYRISAPIGRGGMGAIYRAEQMPLGREVALKLLMGSKFESVDPAFHRRFFREASLCAKLSHPNIVTVFDFGKVDNAPDEREAYFIAMEFLAGESLAQRLKRQQVLALEEALWIAVEIGRGLREAHRQGVVHRDLKPPNVMLVPDPEQGEKLKILDFGLVKSIGGELKEDLTEEGTFIGSPKYMSPEQVSGTEVDHRTDLYSLGIILYRCFAGREPFEHSQSMQVLLAHVSTPVPPIQQFNPNAVVPFGVEAMIFKLLSKSPEHRFENADALVKELRRLQEECGFSPTRTTGVHPAAGSGTPSENEGPISDSWPSNRVSAKVPNSIAKSTNDLSGPTPGGTSFHAYDPTQVGRRGVRRFATAPVLALAGTLALVTAGIVLSLRSRSGDSPAPTLTARESRARAVASSNDTPATQHAASTPTNPPPRETVPSAPSPPPATAPIAPAPVAPTVAAPVEPSSPVTPAAVEAPRSHSSGHHASATPSHAVIAQPTVATPPPEQPAQEFGFLSLDTMPWSQVTLDGHSLGTTPLVHVRLPAGTHTLTLRNPDANITTQYPVTIRANETTSRRLGLE